MSNFIIFVNRKLNLMFLKGFIQMSSLLKVLMKIKYMIEIISTYKNNLVKDFDPFKTSKYWNHSFFQHILLTVTSKFVKRPRKCNLTVYAMACYHYKCQNFYYCQVFSDPETFWGLHKKKRIFFPKHKVPFLSLWMSI